MYLSVIIPAYNEEKRLPKTLRAIDAYLKRQSYDYEILVVNDGSKDRTFEVAKNLESEIKNLKATGYEKNQGKGFAVRFGLLEAKGEYRVFTDADNSTSIDQVEKMWPEFKKGYDIVIGSRDVKGAEVAVPQAYWRRRLGDFFNLLVQLICGLWGIWDTQCGFKGFTNEAAEKILPGCRINRFAFDPEMLIIAKKLGFKIKEVPIRWVNDPHSKVNFKSMIKMLLDLLKIRWNLICRKYD